MAEQARRTEFKDVEEYLSESDIGLWKFEKVGDKIAGTVTNARRIVDEIGGSVKHDPAGREKKALQLMVTDSDNQEWVVTIRSINQKDALRKGLEDAGVTGLATNDYFEMEYTHNDAPLREGLTGAFGYTCKVEPAA